MSHDAHAHDAHGSHEAHEEPHGSFRDYMLGFVLSVVLTAIPFWLVMERPLATTPTAILVIGFAAIQVVVHMVYFLHMNGRAEGGWTMTALLFTIIVVVITIAGSAWVMYHLNTNMMPMPHQMNGAS